MSYFNWKMNIIIIGGTKGIGREVVLSLAKYPENNIIATGRNHESLKKLSDLNKNIHTLPLDLADFEIHAGNFLRFVSENFAKVDILINVAGLMIPKKFLDITQNEARMMMETNFFGPAAVIRLLKPFLLKGSHIVNISSMGGFQGSSKYPGLAFYSASKAAIACLTECLATEFMEWEIKVNCLALGAVQTEMLEQAFPGYQAPVSAEEMGSFISEFALKGHKVFNGKILPVAISNP